jgi:ABC-type bacteriocin/lantibiotic exporter with double-glycine peptidase domain
MPAKECFTLTTSGEAADYVDDRARFRRGAREKSQIARETGAVVKTTVVRGQSAAGTGARALIGQLRAAITGVRFEKRNRVPVRMQSQTSDCGPACLAMVLAHHGVDVSVDQLRQETNAGRDGVSAKTLLTTARRYGIAGRGVRASLGDLRSLAPGSILFWNFSHFVVLERVTSRYLAVVDPAQGRRHIDLATADGSFTGVALEFESPLSARKGSKSLVGKLTDSSHWRYLRYFVPADRAWLPLAAASFLLLGFNFAVPFASEYVISQWGTVHSEGATQVFLAVIAAAVFSFFLLQAVRGLAIASLQALADKKVTIGVLHHLMSLPYGFFARRNAADLAARVRTTVAVRRVLTASALSTVFDGLLILVYGALLLIANTWLAVLVIALALLQMVVLVISWRQQDYLMANTFDFQAKAEGSLVELLAGISTLKAGGLDGDAAERWSHTFADEVNSRMRGGRHFAIYSAVSASLQFAAPLVVLAFGALDLSKREVSLGEVIAFSALTMGLFVPLTSLVLTGMQAAGLSRILERLGDILEAHPENNALETAVVRRVEGAVEARDLYFTYPGNYSATLCGIDFTVAPGGFVGILGQSGSGKSTLAAVLAGMYRPTRGAVLIDGRATDQVDRASLRRSISFLNQNARLFAGSIRDNIAMGRPGATDEEIVAAARAAEIHSDIMTLTMGYSTLLGADGDGVSGGQRQRIALARALIRAPGLIIMDEATSALDRETEDRIFAHLRTLGCTLVVIAHRLAAVSSADMLLVMDHGDIVQRGTHAQLLSEPGRYRTLAFGPDDVQPAGLTSR